MSTSVLQSSITADEVIAPGNTIELASARRSIRNRRKRRFACARVRATRVRIELAKRGRVVTRAHRRGRPRRLRARRHGAARREGRTTRRRLSRCRSRSLPISGKVPEDLRVEHAVRLFIDELHVVRLAPGEERRSGPRRRGQGRPSDERARRSSWRSTSAASGSTSTSELAAVGRDAAPREYGAHPRDAVRAARAGQGQRPRRHRRLAAARASAGAVREAERSPLDRAAGGREEVAASDSQGVRQRCAPRCSARRSRVVTRTSAPTKPCRACARPRPPAQIRRLAENKAVGVILFDDTTAINDLGRFDRRRPLRPRSPGRLRRHRHSRRGLGGRSERHDQPGLRWPLHHDTVGERPRPADFGDRQEHRGQQAPRARARLRPVFGQQRPASTRCAGRCAISTARS